MFPRLRSFLAAWTRREPFEDALDEEVRFHLEACTEELVRAGVPRRKAARRARVRFGSIDGAKDDCRRARGLRLADELEQTMTNVRLGFRMLCRTPVVTCVAVLSLALSRVRSFLTAWTRRERFEDPLDEDVHLRLQACTEDLVRPRAQA